MTESVRMLTVVLDKDYRVDDVEAIVDAIRMTRGVESVVLGEVVGMVDDTAREVAKMELRKELFEFLKPKWGSRR